jgi:aspartyl-tRNA(Asn)/glutamyl-tRNA(Gln) amidotransferase subunit A
MGSSNENSAFGPVRNPVAPTAFRADRAAARRRRWRRARRWWRSAPIPAGPSASRLRFAAWSGVTPTYGRVSRYGLTAFASSLDHIGPFARTVKDAAVLGVIAGRDPRDSTSAEAPVPDYTALDGNVKGLKLGLPREYLKD